jgi:hypothetical protein
MSGLTPRCSGLAALAAERDIDAPTRAAVAPIQSGDPGRCRLPEPGGSWEVNRSSRRRYAVGASGRRLGTPRAGAARATHHADAAATGVGEQARPRPRR